MKNQRGFSLIEVIVAIMVLAIGLISIIGAYSNYVKADTYAKIKGIELNIARSKIEEILAMPIVTLGTATFSKDYSDLGEGYKFEGTVSITSANISDLSTSAYKITVMVTKKSVNSAPERKGVTLIAIREK